MTSMPGKARKPYLKKTRGIMDMDSGDWTYEFEFLRKDGKRGRALVPGEEADTPRGLVRRLNKKGAQLPGTSAERAELLEEVIQAAPGKIVHQLAEAGWQSHRTASPWMSRGHRLIGAPAGNIEYAPPARMARSEAKAFGQNGKLDDWKSRVAAKAVYSTGITVCIAAAFAAPLLAFVEILNFTLHLYGPSRAGKTTGLLCATSVAGTGREEDLPNWNSSGAHLLEAASAFNDLVYPLNEVGAARGMRKNFYGGSRGLHMHYTDGRDRGRHSSWGGGSDGSPQQFRGICIATAEHSLAQYALVAGEKRDDGELFRAIDVHAIRDQSTTILDLAPVTLDQRAYLEQLRTALRECHGTAMASYIQHLQSLGSEEIERETRRLIAYFVTQMRGTEENGVARQIATNLGVLYAGCYFAKKGELLPWGHSHVLNALSRTFADAIETSKVLDPLDLGLSILRSELAAHVVKRGGGATGLESRSTPDIGP